jgi:hypothetical protein
LYDAVIVSRPHNFERFAKIVRTAQPQAVLVYDCEALFWRRMERQAGIALDDAERRNLQQAAQVMRTLEEQIVVDQDAAFVGADESGDGIEHQGFAGSAGAEQHGYAGRGGELQVERKAR